MKLPPALLLLALLVSATSAQEEKEELPPGPPTYAAIDSALVEEIMIPVGATWRYLRGTEEPSPVGEEEPKPGWGWTKPGFDDDDWQEGPTPIGWGHEDHATKLDGIEPPVTTLYMRTVFSIADPGIFEKIHVEMPIDDGFICWLDGEEQDRLHAGHHGAKRAFDAKSSWERTLDMGPLPFVDLTLVLQPGDHVLAIQALVHKDDKESLSVRPLLRATYEPDRAAEEARYELYARRLKAEGAEARLAYLEGRHRQRTGRAAEAVAFFQRAAELDPEARLPWMRLVESGRAAGQLAALDELMRGHIAQGKGTTALLDSWSRAYLEDLDGSPKDLLDLVPAGDLPEHGFFADAYYAGSELAAGNALRIDCGAAEDHRANGSTWGRDRFAQQGYVEEWTGDKRPFEVVRVGTRAIGDLSPTYRVPVPDGTYLLALYLVADGSHRFDVFVEGARTHPEFDPSKLEGDLPLRFPVFVSDGFLELEVFPHTLKWPRIAGFVIEPIGSEGFEALARDWAEETSWGLASPIVQLAEVSFMKDDLGTAFDFFEQASDLGDFRPADRARMAMVEDALLPRLLSYRMVDDLLARRGDEAEELLPKIKAEAQKGARRSRAEAAWDDDAAALALYFEGRMHQLTGHLDEAIPAFEELAFSGRDEPEPLLRFAECLVDSQLAPEAEGLLREGLFDGIPATPALLRLWISLNLSELERDEWEIVADLSELDVPEELVVVPTSEAVGQPFAYLEKDPPSTTWSRPQFDASPWKTGLGGIGTETPNGGVVRSSWETQVVFARTPFTLPGRKLLYPHARANADDAGDVYLNGTMVSRISARTDGYVDLPVRKGSFEEGLNYLGIYAINYRGPGFADVGLHEPLADLIWVLEQLDQEGAIRINCGSAAPVEAGGKTWSQDRFYGYALSGRAEAQATIQDTDLAQVYRTQSYFTTAEIYTAWYQIPLPRGRYQVTLHFAELEERDAEEKPRPFTVKLQKQEVLKDHDVIATAGAHLMAQTHTFEVLVTDGWLDLDFSYKQKAFVNGIEVERVE